MPWRRRATSAALWIGSILLASGVTWLVTRTSPVAPTLPAANPANASAVVSTTETEALEAEIISLRAQLEDARNKNLRLALADLVRQAQASAKKETTAGTESIEQTYTRQLARIRLREGMFLGGLEEKIQLLVMFARLGDDGVRFLLSQAKDTSDAHQSERQAAMELLAEIPHRDTLAYFLQTPQLPESSNADRVKALALQVAGLSSRDVTPYAGALYTEAQNAIAANDTRDGLTLLTDLAFLHEDTQSERALSDRALWSLPSFQFAVGAANDLHTDSARKFLTDVSQSHPSPEIRAQAANALAAWSGNAARSSE